MRRTTSSRSGQLCPRCASKPYVRERIYPQSLITAIPALVKMGKQVIGDSIGLVLDPWSWRARLVGTLPTTQKDKDSGPQPDPTHKAFLSDSTRRIPSDLRSQRNLDHQGLRSFSPAASKGKRGKKTVHFIEPDQNNKPSSGASNLKLPAEQTKIELYEVISPADDLPRIIDVDYDTNNNRWRMDESATFPDREDPVAVICSKSVLRAMKGDLSTTASASSTNQPLFQVNRLPDYGVIKNPEGGLAKLKASSHDLFHIGNLENFLLHTKQDPQHVISSSGGQYMKHWLIDLRQLITLFSDPDTRQKCKSAFWELFHCGFAEKVTLQLWGASDPQPEESADIETLDWTSWVKKYKGGISEALLQDLGRALAFFYSRTVTGSPWPAVLCPKMSIMSHKGITFASVTETKVDDGRKPVGVDPCACYTDPIPPDELAQEVPNDASISVEPWVPSAKDPRPPPPTPRFVHTLSPHPYPRNVVTALPKSVVTQLLSSRPSSSERYMHTPPNPRPGGPLVSEKCLEKINKLSQKGPLNSATSVPLFRSSSPTLVSAVSVTSSDLTETPVPSEVGYRR